MSTTHIESSCLGEHSALCGKCGREISVEEHRKRCLRCREYYCKNCTSCSTHEVVTIKGFRRLRDLDEVLSKADKYLSETSGKFHVDSDIYVMVISQLVAYLRARRNNPELATRFVEDVPVQQRQFYEQHGEDFIKDWVSLRDMGRFVDYFDRRAIAGRLPGEITWMHSQGAYNPIVWRQLPMMRTVWDFALAAIMVQEIQPKTIIELGTASGGTAVWYADLQRIHGLTPNVKTMDIDPPSLEREGVTIFQGDSDCITKCLPYCLMDNWPHPWLVVEDAHRNIGNIISHFHNVMVAGDYLAIEDIDAEYELGNFLMKHRGQYKVDARYTDYFGHNTTCCADQILRRMS